MRRGDGAKPDNYTFAARSAPKPRKSYSNLGRKQVTAFLKQSAADMTFGLRHPIRRVTGKNQGPQNMIFPGFGGKVPTKVHVPAPKEALARTFAESKAADPRIALNRKLAGQAHRMRPTPDAAMYDWLDMGTKSEVTPRGMAIQQQLEKFQNRMRGELHSDRMDFAHHDFRPFQLDFLRRPKQAIPEHVREAMLEEGMFSSLWDQRHAQSMGQRPIYHDGPNPAVDEMFPPVDDDAGASLLRNYGRNRDRGPTYPQDINDLRRMLTRIPQAPERHVRPELRHGPIDEDQLLEALGEIGGFQPHWQQPFGEMVANADAAEMLARLRQERGVDSFDVDDAHRALQRWMQRNSGLQEGLPRDFREVRGWEGGGLNDGSYARPTHRNTTPGEKRAFLMDLLRRFGRPN